MNKSIILLKNLLRSTSRLNSYRYCRDRKKRKKIAGALIGQGILYLLFMAFCIVICVGYGKFGLAGSIPVMCATVISGMAFFLTFFKTNGYLFGFRDYDMLMSLPFGIKNIAMCKFLYMYITGLPWVASVSLALMVGYGICEKPSAMMYPIWILLSLFLPVIPMLAAAFLGFLIAKIGSGFRNKSIAQTVFTTLIIFACFGLRYFIEDMFRENKTEAVLGALSDATGSAGEIYLPIEWFRRAVTELHVSDMLLLAGATILLFEAVFIPVGRSYRKINSALMSHRHTGGFVMGDQKKRSVIGAIVFKEFKRMTGSSVYMTNVSIGELMCVVAGIAALFVNIDQVLRSVLKEAPITKEMLCPSIPFIVYFFVGMVATTAITPSLEGKNYWIVQSLPIEKKTLYQGKMLFNMYLTVPFASFATLAFCISARVSVISTVLFLILEIVLCAFSTAWGCVCGIRHLRLDWENEIEVIKQSSAVTVYLLPNMFVTMALIPLTVFLGTVIGPNPVTLLMIFAYLMLAFLSYRKVMAFARVQDDH